MKLVTKELNSWDILNEKNLKNKRVQKHWALKLTFIWVLIGLLLVAITFFCSFSNQTEIEQTYIYVSDARNFEKGPWKIIRYNKYGDNPVDFIKTELAWPQDILFLEEKNEVLISNLNSGKINRYNADTGELIGLFAKASGPTRLKVGHDNLLYVLQWSGNGKVLRYKLDGSFVDEFTEAGVFRAIGLDWDAKNNLYVSSYKNACIRKFDERGKDMGTFVESNLKGPTNIWFDGSGNLLVNDWSENRVVRFDPNGNFVDYFINNGLSQPEGVDFFEDGSFIIGSGGTSEVKLYTSDGTPKGSLITKGHGGLKQPNAVRIRITD